jgi:hypothetical protein
VLLQLTNPRPKLKISENNQSITSVFPVYKKRYLHSLFVSLTFSLMELSPFLPDEAAMEESSKSAAFFQIFD